MLRTSRVKVARPFRDSASCFSAEATSQQLFDQAVAYLTTATKLAIRIPSVAAKRAFHCQDTPSVLIYHTAGRSGNSSTFERLRILVKG